MTNDRQIKVLWVDFFGVLCSEVAPFWFQKYFKKEESIVLKERYCTPADLGEISNVDLMNHLSELVEKPVETVTQEFNSYIKINTEVVSYLEKLKESYKIILCSNAHSDFIRKIISDNNLERLFNEMVISSEIKCKKPDVKFFEKCFELSQADKKEIVFIDDSETNTKAAQDFGIRTILFNKHTPLSLYI